MPSGFRYLFSQADPLMLVQDGGCPADCPGGSQRRNSSKPDHRFLLQPLGVSPGDIYPCITADGFPSSSSQVCPRRLS